MPRVLVTAFEPYDVWSENASWLALVELTRDLPVRPEVTTRLYPVDYAEMRKRLERDLAAGYDFALHLGQAPGAAVIELESIGINAASIGEVAGECKPLVDDGPVAYRSSLPLGAWAVGLRESGIPARVSYHAGTYLCNATLYLSHYIAERQRLATRSVFIHLPLETRQIIPHPKPLASMPRQVMAQALRQILVNLELPVT
ncbi:MAG: pyroglutamyl-peptidase I [Pirellulaceae bacterium]